MDEELYAKLLAAAARVENERMRGRDFPNGASKLSKLMQEGTRYDQKLRRLDGYGSKQ